jgi:hypothetical protein
MTFLGYKSLHLRGLKKENSASIEDADCPVIENGTWQVMSGGLQRLRLCPADSQIEDSYLSSISTNK